MRDNNSLVYTDSSVVYNKGSAKGLSYADKLSRSLSGDSRRVRRDFQFLADPV